VRTALLWLVLGFGLNLILETPPSVAAPAWLFALRVGGFHMLVGGWLTQLIFGVAYWMFPRRSPQVARGGEWLGWLGYIGLNAGLLGRIAAEPLAQTYGVARWALVGSAVAQLSAALALIALVWGRVRER
jgi:hypothetical protein